MYGNDAAYQQQQMNNNPYNTNAAGPYQQPYQPQPYNQNVPPQPATPVVYHVNVNSGANTCPLCRRDAGSVAVRKTSCVQWAWCFIIFLFFWPLCCVPFCIDSCSDVEYRCTSCNGIRNSYKAPFCPL